MDLQKVLLRQKIIALTRDFFVDKNFQEYTIPVLNRSLPLEPNLYSFTTNWTSSQDKLYMTVSPESHIKKLLSLNPVNSYAISHCFRNLESAGPTHQPEFLMLEFYQKPSDYISIMNTIEELCNYIYERLDRKSNNRTNNVFTYQNRLLKLTSPWLRISMSDLFSAFAHLDLSQNLSLSQLQSTASQKGYQVTPADTWESLFDQIFLNEIEPHLNDYGQPVFITDYPSSISPLCQPHSANPDFCQRFELYFGNLELANGCTENTDSSLLQYNFDTELSYRIANRLPTHPVDQEFITASSKISGFAGAGLGIDRLAMLFTDSASIDQVLLSSL